MDKVTPPGAPSGAFRVGFVPGVMPGKWERAWRERMRRPLELVTVEVSDQEKALREGRVDMCLVRGEVDRETFHLIPLYREVPVVVVPADHPVTAYDEIDIAELADEHDVLHEHPGLALAQAVETVAAGTGILVVPMSLARLHHRKDVAFRPVTGVEESPVGLAWVRPAPGDPDDPDIQAFIGIIRGRSPRSSRG
ncbi:LysR substrate-binding domain-containing protein [Nocardioides pocheonensis]|nr:LysR substrate-binding domain-containing protein [Nocardioides pocheonensis]